MIGWVPRPSTIVLVAALLVILSGCTGSTPTRFYVLRSSADAPSLKPSERPAEEPCLSIGIGPVRVAEYLDRPEIVTRVAPNEIRVTDLDQWAEPLRQNISRVLAENLSSFLCTRVVVLYPWNASAPIDYQVEVDINRLDGPLGGDSTLEARWMAFRLGRPKTLVAARKVVFTEPAGGKDYQALVASESRALEALSRDIAEILKTSPREGNIMAPAVR
jgi:uncharacterized protein